MFIGVDFDNTIVCYETLFHRVARDHGWIPADLAVSKNAVRDHLRRAGQEDRWTEMQGEVYGPRMPDASPFPGVFEFFQACRGRRIPVCIVSHRSRHPYLGPPHDLHQAARDWLASHAVHAPTGASLPASQVYFELTKQAKIERIASLGCTHFIDDLPELLTDPLFPSDVEKFLFDPADGHADSAAYCRVRNWSTLADRLLASHRSDA